MSKQKLDRLLWSNFQEIYLGTTAPSVIHVLDQPRVEIVAVPAEDRVTLRLWTAEQVVAIGTPRAITARYVSLGQERVLEVSTSVRHLHQPFLNLIFAICDQLLSGSGTAANAVESALADFRQLLAGGDLLSDEQLQGLFGELWTLRELIQVNGARSVDAWTGAKRLTHDFRYGQTELEVKTTASANARHHINGAGQLVPSVGCSLYLVSVLAQPTGPAAGYSVPEVVSSITALLSAARVELGTFQDRLRAADYREADAVHYLTRWALRAAPKAIFIDSEFPCITQGKLDRMLGAAYSGRISDVGYSLDVSGLGVEHGTDEFRKIITI
ncbi:hypothetical protein ACVWYH_009746 [Bradyrhizobium sp. GM24.11]